MDTYQTGTENLEIIFSLDITTIGFAASRVITGKPGSAQPPVSVAHSVDATGDISKTSIGNASNLAGEVLNVMTTIDLSAIADPKLREKESERISSTITLDHGIQGLKTFVNTGNKTISQDFIKVIINTSFNLTA